MGVPCRRGAPDDGCRAPSSARPAPPVLETPDPSRESVPAPPEAAGLPADAAPAVAETLAETAAVAPIETAGTATDPAPAVIEAPVVAAIEAPTEMPAEAAPAATSQPGARPAPDLSIPTLSIPSMP